jgi:hypothetical protein
VVEQVCEGVVHRDERVGARRETALHPCEDALPPGRAAGVAPRFDEENRGVS